MKKLITVAGICLVVAGVSFAYGAGMTKFADEDTNHDGQMSWEESQAGFPNLTRVLFDAADEDHNGTISEAEYSSLWALCPTE